MAALRLGLIQASGAMRKIGVPVTWLVGVIAAALAGLRSDPYLKYVQHMPPPHPYPIDIVLGIIGLMTLQAALVLVVLRPATYSCSWGRALIALVISFGFLALGAIGAMHAPPPWTVYLVWLLVLLLATLILSLRSAIGVARTRPAT